jgi:hypothetical protein
LLPYPARKHILIYTYTKTREENRTFFYFPIILYVGSNKEKVQTKMKERHQSNFLLHVLINWARTHLGAAQLQGATQLGAAQSGAAQLGAAQLGAAQLGAAQSGAAQLSAAQLQVQHSRMQHKWVLLQLGANTSNAVTTYNYCRCGFNWYLYLQFFTIKFLTPKTKDDTKVLQYMGVKIGTRPAVNVDHGQEGDT